MMTPTAERIRNAALQLFAEKGFAKTSIADIETEAGLAPRAGAFYRHFESKQALLIELAHTKIAERTEDFDFQKLGELGDTRAELVAIAQKYERAARRQMPYLRVIEELRLTDVGREIEHDVNEEMLAALTEWVSSKAAGQGLSRSQLAALTLNVIGPWLFYLTKLQQGVDLQVLDRDTLLDHWATTWGQILDGEK